MLATKAVPNPFSAGGPTGGAYYAAQTPQSNGKETHLRTVPPQSFKK